ncbi:MAG: FecR domain-containing protein [Candidatus Nealsonbacteria bacterium]
MSKKFIYILSIIIISLIVGGIGVYFSSNVKADSDCYTNHHSFEEWKEIKEEKSKEIKILNDYLPCYNAKYDAVNAYGQAQWDGKTSAEGLAVLKASADALKASCITPDGLKDNCDGYNGPYCDNRYPWHQINLTLEEYIVSKENYINNTVLPSLEQLEKTCGTGAGDVVVDDVDNEEEEEEEIEGDVKITVDNNNLMANGMSNTIINIVVADKDEKKVSGKSLTFRINNNNNLIEEGTLSLKSALTNSNGKASIEYTAPVIGDPNFKGGTVKIEVSIGEKTFDKDINLIPAILIKGKVVDIKGVIFPNIPIKYYCYKEGGGKFLNELSSNEKGEFFIAGIKDKNCTINIGYKFQNYITINKSDIEAPFDLGTLILATRKEFEKDTSEKIINMLIRSGMEKAEANEIINNISFDYDNGGPEFYNERPTWAREKLGLPGWASLRIPSEQYWPNAEWDTIFHEYGHVVMFGLAYDEDAETGEDHDIWTKTNRDTAFDEARAHFFSLLMLRETNRNGDIADEFIRDTALSSLESEKVEGNRIEGVITTFWEKVYGSQIYVCPSCVIRDFMDIQNKFKDDKGRSPRTIEEWIDGEKLMRQGDRIYGIANDLKINHNGSIDVGYDQTLETDKITLEIEGDGEMSAVYGGVGKKRTVTGQVELKVNEEIETKNSNGKIVFPDGSYIKLRPGAKAQVFNRNFVIIRNGNTLIRVLKRDEEFQIVSPESNIIVKVKGTTLETIVDDNGNTIIKLIEGEVDITDLEGNHLEKLLAGEQYNSLTKEKSEFDANKSLEEWEEEKEKDYIENQEDGKETKKIPFSFFIIIGVLIIGAGTFFIIKKKQQTI